MKHLQTFEDRFGDIFKNNTSKFDKYKNQTFIEDCGLVNKIVIDGKILTIEWNNTVEHNLFNRIKERTNIKSVSEFNDIFENCIKEIIPDEINNNITNKNSLYLLYLINRKFYIMVEINYDNLFEIDTTMKVKTITLSSNKKIKTININDDF